MRRRKEARMSIGSSNLLGISVRMVTVLAGPFLLSGTADAQTVDLAESLRCFEEVHRGGDHIVTVQYRCPSGAVPIEGIVTSPHRFGHPIVQEALDRLVVLALSSDDEHLQAAACHALHRAGATREIGGEVRVPGVVHRLEELYFSGRSALRRSCLGVPRTQADRPRMIEFLKRIATEADPPDAGSMWPASLEAINALEAFGEEGRAVIAELVAAGSISTYPARVRAEQVLLRPPGR